MEHITIDGKRYAWSYILKLRRKQKRNRWRGPVHLKNDYRSLSERSLDGRYLEPTLFSLMD
jgi:hypothetical protein